jgi:hypothetical protein
LEPQLHRPIIRNSKSKNLNTTIKIQENMKLNTLAVILVAGISASAFGQGVILQNVGTGAGGTNGAVYMQNGTKFDGINFNLGVTVSGGINAGSLAPVGLGTYTLANDPKGYTGLDVGLFQLGATASSVNIPGVAAGGVATIQLQVWYDGATGLFANYGAAAAGGGQVGTVTFLQNTSNLPLTPAGPLNGMPDIHLAAGVVPEPSTLALAGLGAASVLLFRRRK